MADLAKETKVGLVNVNSLNMFYKLVKEIILG